MSVVDTSLPSIMRVRVGLVSEFCGANEKLDADALICALAAENDALRDENQLMAKSLDAEELRVGLSTTGGMWRFWRDKADELARENVKLQSDRDALRAENERLRATPPEVTALVEALRPFAEAAMHLHPANPNEATTLDGIEVGQWRAAYAALTEWEAAQK